MILCQAEQKHIFWTLVHTCPWNYPPQVSERSVFDEFEWKYHKFIQYRTVQVEHMDFIA